MVIKYYILLLTLLINPFSCRSVQAVDYIISDPVKEEASITNLFAHFVEYVSLGNEIPVYPDTVKDHFTDIKFYEYFHVSYINEDKSATSHEIMFVDPLLNLYSHHKYRNILYLRAYSVDENNERSYFGFTFLYILPSDYYADYVSDRVNWEGIVELEDQSSIPYSFMIPDGKIDPIMIRLDFYKDMPVLDEDNIFWERS